jgi:hypothetical protein
MSEPGQGCVWFVQIILGRVQDAGGAADRYEHLDNGWVLVILHIKHNSKS